MGSFPPFRYTVFNFKTPANKYASLTLNYRVLTLSHGGTLVNIFPKPSMSISDIRHHQPLHSQPVAAVREVHPLGEHTELR